MTPLFSILSLLACSTPQETPAEPASTGPAPLELRLSYGSEKKA